MTRHFAHGRNSVTFDVGDIVRVGLCYGRVIRCAAANTVMLPSPWVESDYVPYATDAGIVYEVGVGCLEDCECDNDYDWRDWFRPVHMVRVELLDYLSSRLGEVGVD